MRTASEIKRELAKKNDNPAPIRHNRFFSRGALIFIRPVRPMIQKGPMPIRPDRGHDLDDHTLAAAAARNDPQALRLLCERYRRYVYTIAYKIVRNEEDALDVAQEALLKIVRRIDQWEGRGSLNSWIGAVAAREAIDWRRRPARRESPTDPDVLARIVGDGGGGMRGDPRKKIETEQRRRMVEETMGELSAQQRAVLTLRLGEEPMMPEEIAERLEIPVKQVRVQISRAIARLRTIFEKEGELR